MIYKYDEETGEMVYEPFVIGITDKSFLLECLNAWKKEKGYTFEFIGDLIGLHYSTVVQLFNGTRGITLDNLIKLLRVFGWRLALEEITGRFPYDYELTREEDIELTDYSIMQMYIKDYQSGLFKGTYKEYRKATIDYEE